VLPTCVADLYSHHLRWAHLRVLRVACSVLRARVLLPVGEKLPEPIHNPTKIESAKPSSFFPHGIKIVEGAPQPYNPPSPWSWPTDWSMGGIQLGGTKTAAKPPEIQSSWSPRPVEAAVPMHTVTKSVLHVGAPVREEEETEETEGAGTAHSQMVWDAMPQTGGGRKGLEVGGVKRTFTTLDISNGDCLPTSHNFELVKTICCGLGSPPGAVVQELSRQAGVPSYCPKAEEKVERAGEGEASMAPARDRMSHVARARQWRASQPQSQATMQAARAGDDASGARALDEASAPHLPQAHPARRKPEGEGRKLAADTHYRKHAADTEYVSRVSDRELVSNAKEVCLCVRASACPPAQGVVCGTAVCRMGVGTLQPCASHPPTVRLRGGAQEIQRNNDLIGHFRQEQKLLEPQRAQSHASAGQEDDVMTRGDMETGVDREVEATLAARLAGALISSASAAHADTEEQAEEEAAPPAAADVHSRRAADVVGTASAAHVSYHGQDSSNSSAAHSPYHELDGQKRRASSNSIKLTFVLEGTNTHLMTDLQLKQFGILVMLHSQPAQDPGISCHPRHKCARGDDARE